jgi:hypothetical protein
VLAFSGLNSLAPNAPIRPRSRHRPRQRCGDFTRASAPSLGSPCGFPGARRTMRPTDFCFPSHSYEHPRLVGSCRVARLPSRGAGELALHDANSASAGPSLFFWASGDVPSVRSAKDRTSDTPVASPCLERRRFRTHRSVRGRRDRLRRAFVKRARLHDPKCLPSAGDSASRSPARGVLPPSTRYGPRLSPVSWLCHHDPVLGCLFTRPRL